MLSSAGPSGTKMGRKATLSPLALSPAGPLAWKIMALLGVCGGRRQWPLFRKLEQLPSIPLPPSSSWGVIPKLRVLIKTSLPEKWELREAEYGLLPGFHLMLSLQLSWAKSWGLKGREWGRTRKRTVILLGMPTVSLYVSPMKLHVQMYAVGQASFESAKSCACFYLTWLWHETLHTCLSSSSSCSPSTGWFQYFSSFLTITGHEPDRCSLMGQDYLHCNSPGSSSWNHPCFRLDETHTWDESVIFKNRNYWNIWFFFFRPVWDKLTHMNI